jgi:hypothetical protein
MHVYNDYIRFFNYRLVKDNDVLYIRDSIIPITSIGKIYYIVTCPNNTKRKIIQKIILYKVVYIPLFYYSIALLRKFLKVNIY